MIQIFEGYVYEREACDCCDGWYSLQYRLVIDDEYKGTFTDAADVLVYLAGNTKDFTFHESEVPDYD